MTDLPSGRSATDKPLAWWVNYTIYMFMLRKGIKLEVLEQQDRMYLVRAP